MRRDQYRLILSVECPGGKRHSTAFEVGAHAAPQFEPYDLCSSPMGAGLAGGVMPQRAARIDVGRETLAQQIAGILTESILEQIKSRDLRNGYEQTPQKP